MLLEVFNEPLMHQQRVWSARNIRMNSNGEYKVIVLAIKIVKMIAPYILNVTRVHESMLIIMLVLLRVTHCGISQNMKTGVREMTYTIRRVLDEHHGRQVV